MGPLPFETGLPGGLNVHCMPPHEDRVMSCLLLLIIFQLSILITLKVMSLRQRSAKTHTKRIRYIYKMTAEDELAFMSRLECMKGHGRASPVVISLPDDPPSPLPDGGPPTYTLVEGGGDDDDNALSCPVHG